MEEILIRTTEHHLKTRGGGTNYRKNRVSEDCKRLSSASGDAMMSRE